MNETMQKLIDAEGKLNYVSTILKFQTLEAWERKEYESLEKDYQQEIEDLKNALNV